MVNKQTGYFFSRNVAEKKNMLAEKEKKKPDYMTIRYYLFFFLKVRYTEKIDRLFVVTSNLKKKDTLQMKQSCEL